MALLALLIALVSFSLNDAAVPVAPNMKSFSSAIKGGHLAANVEKTLYERGTGQPGVITEQWFTGKGAMNEDTRIRIYVDNETSPSLDFQLLLAHGIGYGEKLESPNVPWNAAGRIGHEADGGIYNTYRVPYGKSIRITATRPTTGTFWYIVRGVENYPIIVGDLQFPANTRLKLYKTIATQLAPRQFVHIANVSDASGALYQVTLAANSTDFNYLEACMRVSIDGEDTMFLSSGTEDFFLSAYYFNKGLYHSENSGCTYKGGSGLMSAYKFFEKDPILFTKSLDLIWRCGETANGDDGCPNDFPPPHEPEKKIEMPPLQLANTVVTIYVWVYEW